MNYSFTNDELFVMCIIHGCDEVTGLASPFVAMSDEDERELFRRIADSLKDKDVVFISDGSYKLKDEYESLINLMTKPNVAYILVDEKDLENEFVFIVRKQSAKMLNKELTDCEIETYEEIEKLKDYFRQKYRNIRVSQSPVQYMISITSDIMEQAIGKVKDGDMDMALKVLSSDEFDRDEMKGMLEAIVYPEQSETIIGRSYEGRMSTESIVKICNSAEGTWILKISTQDECRNTMVFKATAEDVTKVLFEF